MKQTKIEGEKRKTEWEDEKLAPLDAYQWFALPHLAEAVLYVKLGVINQSPARMLELCW